MEEDLVEVGHMLLVTTVEDQDVQDCLNLMCLSCRYCTQFNHAIEDFPVLLAKICEKGAQPQQLTQNLQMMRVEP